MKKRVFTTVGLMLFSLLTFQLNPPANAADLYAFTSHTFTNCTRTGNLGPTLIQCKSAYSAQSWSTNSSYYNVGGTGIQYWTVPKTGIYTIQAAGAAGGAVSGRIAGSGATMQGDFVLTQGSIVAIVVGQMGLALNSSGGGGGSFVLTVPNQGDTSTSGILLAAGGGGGSSSTANYTYVTTTESATTSTSGGSGTCSNFMTGCVALNYLLSNGGINGNGGRKGNLNSIDGAGGGGGLFTDGESNTTTNYANGGQSFFNGSKGGTTSTGSTGGFGGGGASEYMSNAGSGGGGGYSGGGGGIGFAPGGGGGSYNAGANKVNVAGNNTGMGYVTVTYLSAWAQPAITSTSFPTTATYRGTVSLSASVNASGKVTFLASGKVIPGCKSILVSNVNGGTATCSWKPTVHGAMTVTAYFTSGIYSDSSLPVSVGISSRAGNR